MVMRIYDLLRDSSELKQLAHQCSQFVVESGGLPLFKMLPTSYDDYHRVKVRQKKQAREVDVVFNEAFKQYPGLRQRAVFAHPLPVLEHVEGREPFFVFPIDGYKYMWNAEVHNSHEEYQTVFEAIVEGVGPEASASVIVDMLHLTYHQNKLQEGIDSDSEIIFYNIPCYYAVRVTSNDPYDQYCDLLTNLAI